MAGDIHDFISLINKFFIFILIRFIIFYFNITTIIKNINQDALQDCCSGWLWASWNVRLPSPLSLQYRLSNIRKIRIPKGTSECSLDKFE